MSAIKNYWKERRSVVLLLLLLLAIAAVYSFDFFRSRANAARLGHISPTVVQLIQQQQGKPLVFPFFQKGFHRPDFRHMTREQREAFHRQMHARMEAFFLAYAHATPAQRQQMAMPWGHHKWGHKPAGAPPFKGRRGPHGPHGPHGNWQAHLPQLIANGLLRGHPQMRAAATGFFMSRRNSAH